MNRFFVPKGNISEGHAIITGEDMKHITRVLRMREGDPLIISDGVSMEYHARIESVKADEILISLNDGVKCENELPFETTLIQGLPKAGKMELIIQKCTELGLSRVIPVAAARSVVRLTEKEFEKKRIRYEKVAAEAAKQAQRGIQPEVKGLHSFSDIDFSAFDLILLFYEEEKEMSLKRALGRIAFMPKRIAIIIGPEGGIEKDEAESIISRGGVAVSLGKRILRTETAGMAALAMLQYALGDA